MSWIGVRFLLFGLGGLWLLLIFSLDFIAGLHFRGATAASLMGSLLALLIAIVGAFMLLFAVGRWGQWAYMGVILSIPATLLLATTVMPADKGLATGLAIAVTASASNAAVRAYYRRRTAPGA